MDCRDALEKFGGDAEQAAAFLREKGMEAAAKRSARQATEGLIGSYIHAGSRVAALVELNCETDFVALTDEFQTLAHDLAMQVVAGKPLYVKAEEVPAEMIAEQKAQFLAEMKDSGKPQAVIEKAIEGKLEKFLEEICLLNQPFIKDTAVTIGELVRQKNALLGENLVVRRFARFEVGG